MKSPEVIELSAEEMEGLMQRVQGGGLKEGDVELILAMAETIKVLSEALGQKNISIGRLKNMLFGAKTEKTATVVEKYGDREGSGLKKGEGEHGTGDGARQKDSHFTEDKKKHKGHGRNGADEYKNASRVYVEHPSLKRGDPCPVCPKGKVYPLKKPAKVIRLTGQAPIQATIYELQRLRCNGCGKVFTAQAPEEAGNEKYEETVGSMIAVLRYGYGFPFNRLEELQRNLHTPLPASTQWGIVDPFADQIGCVFYELVRQAAQGEVVYIDDTNVRILELMKENQQYRNQEETESRTGMFTTGIISTVGKRKMALFYSGRNHAGENMKELMGYRETDRSPPIQMCDALSRNLPEGFDVILSNCLSHARRQFVEITEVFPQECIFLLETLKQVYRNEERVKRVHMTADQRLAFHQKESDPLMDGLKEWMQNQFDEKKVEPNSSLGKTFTYMQNHWEALTLFLREPNAPLDNNICNAARGITDNMPTSGLCRVRLFHSSFSGTSDPDYELNRHD